MTGKEKQNMKVLGLVLAILLAVLVLVIRTNHGDSSADAADANDEPNIPVSTGSMENTDETAPEEITADKDDSFIPEQNYTGLSWTSNGLTLTFTLNEENEWKWADNIDYPLESATVLRILNNLKGLIPQRVITEGDTLESYGLQNPPAVLTAYGDKQTITLSFGNLVSDGYNYYMLLNNDDSTVYVVPSLIYQDMQIPIYDMCQLPEFPDLWDEKNIQSVRIEGLRSGVMTSVLTAQRNGDANQTDHTENTLIWTGQNGQMINAGDNETIAALLEDFSLLEISQCIDYMPTPEAEEICGFTEAVLTLEYTEPQEEENPTDDGGVEEDAVINTDAVDSEPHVTTEPEVKTLVLRIGGEDTDRGGRYVQLDDSRAIYLVSGEVLERVIQVASSGLDA